MKSKLKNFGIMCAVVAAASLSPSAAKASSVVDKVTRIRVTGTNIGLLFMLSTPSSRPGCHNSLMLSAYAFDISTSKGKAMLSFAQAALLSGKSLNVVGGTACTNVGGTELVETIQTLSIEST